MVSLWQKLPRHGLQRLSHEYVNLVNYSLLDIPGEQTGGIGDSEAILSPQHCRACFGRLETRPP
jgi:hypothetical protein